MKPIATKLTKIAALISACASLTSVTIVVSQEVAYVNAKVIKLKNVDAAQVELKWPTAVALPDVQVSPGRASVQLGAAE